MDQGLNTDVVDEAGGVDGRRLDLVAQAGGHLLGQTGGDDGGVPMAMSVEVGRLFGVKAVSQHKGQSQAAGQGETQHPDYRFAHAVDTTTLAKVSRVGALEQTGTDQGTQIKQVN